MDEGAVEDDGGSERRLAEVNGRGSVADVEEGCKKHGVRVQRGENFRTVIYELRVLHIFPFRVTRGAAPG